MAAVQPLIDRTVIHVVRLDDRERDDLEYWLARSPRERLEAVEQDPSGFMDTIPLQCEL